MLQFHPGLPFPLLKEGTYTYADAQNHAERVDGWLGLQTLRVESALNERGCMARAPNSTQDHQQLWIGLATQNLLTPYVEIRRILGILNPQPGDTVVDLGAAYGRIGFVIGQHYPDVQFLGYEFVGERLRESQKCLQRLKFQNVKMEHADLSAPGFIPDEARFYFIYDYGKPRAIEKTLHDLRRIAQRRRIEIVARGQTCQQAIASRHTSWLKKQCLAESNGRSSIYISLESIL
jgi:precorrin-6B methylase 2